MLETMARRRSARTFGKAITAAMFCVAAFGVPALGDDRSFDDADDADGRFDVATARHGHDEITTDQVLVSHGFEFYETWENEALEAPLNRIVLFFNLDDDSHAERRLSIDVSEDGSLHAVMIADRRRKQDRVRGYAHVWRSSDRGVEIRFPTALLANRVGDYQWRITTEYNDDADLECGTVGGVVATCYDSAPDEGSYRHR
ncbi:MAG: hypothetical protein ABR613_09055 [Actinomycetota bacterium]